MKRCKLSYDEWKCIISKKISGMAIQNNYINGYIGLIEIEEVTKPQIWSFNGENIIVCDRGKKWLSILPQNDFFCITAMMNENDTILLWYIDMIADQGIELDGIPYFDDLYLDLVVYPDGTIIEDDMNELEEELRENVINPQQYELAIETSKRLRNTLLFNIESFIDYTFSCYDLIIRYK